MIYLTNVNLVKKKKRNLTKVYMKCVNLFTFLFSDMLGWLLLLACHLSLSLSQVNCSSYKWDQTRSFWLLYREASMSLGYKSFNVVMISFYPRIIFQDGSHILVCEDFNLLSLWGTLWLVLASCYCKNKHISSFLWSNKYCCWS